METERRPAQLEQWEREVSGMSRGDIGKAGQKQVCRTIG